MNHYELKPQELHPLAAPAPNTPLRLEVLSEAIRKNYLTRLNEMPVVEIPHLSDEEMDLIRNVRVFQITEMVYEKHESVVDKLAAVYNALTNTKASLFLLLDSDGFQTRFYLGIRNLEEEQEGKKRSTVSLRDTLHRTLRGHFPGVKTRDQDRRDIARLCQTIRKGEHVASVSVVAAPRKDAFSENDQQTFVQGLEKLVLAMKGCTYTALILAENQLDEQVADLRNQYEELYSSLSPWKHVQFSQGETESSSSPQRFSEMNNQQKMNAVFQLAGPILGAGVMAGGAAMGAGAYLAGMAVSQIAGQLSQFVNGLMPVPNLTTGTSSTVSQTYENKTVTEILKVLDQQMERCSQFETYGLWQTAAYFVSPDLNTVEIAASHYRSLMSGSHSSLEVSAINLWQKRLMDPPASFDHLIQSISRFVHPRFQYSPGVCVSAATAVSGKELALHLGLPRSSVSGLPVIEHAQFGKEVHRCSVLETSEVLDPKDRLTLGHIYDLGRSTPQKVELNNRSLNMHTFITGSTGSGKSNAVYQMLSELHQDRIPFLVIEPAKGEYKDFFGHLPDVRVYSTNPREAQLLHINPFQFPESIHVLEHIDGLVEIFSVCWPMYDAMPAFFKESILKAYEAVGWDLGTSAYEGQGDDVKFPDFQIVAEELDQLISSSDYAAEIKSNYRGALLTRVRSLTVGLNKYIFSSEQTPYSKLFNDNCILDLSRVKSQETKSFLMGLLVYLLNEYRMDQKQRSNAGLRHVTVLEEAHNILKNKTGSYSELTGKSVEILTNTLAEIRTYGEGFIIVDQSPSSVDLAAIKNTNTKIVLRTPEANDREAIGRSMGLNADQVDEIAKLPTGVAVVYQNDWIDPVLTSIHKANVKEQPYLLPDSQTIRSKRAARTDLIAMLLQPWLKQKRLGRIDLREDIRLLDLDRKTQRTLEQVIDEYVFGNGTLIWSEQEIPALQCLVRKVLGLDDARWMEILILGINEIKDVLERLLQTNDWTDPRQAVNEICWVLTRTKEGE